MPKIADLENEFSSTQETDDDNRNSGNNCSPSVIAHNQQPPYITKQKQNVAAKPEVKQPPGATSS